MNLVHTMPANPLAGDPCALHSVRGSTSPLESDINMTLYDVILADPPWHFKTYGKSNANLPQSYYETMHIEDICKLSIPAKENAALFLWVVDWMSPSICESVANAWGFTYRTNAWAWVKSKPSGFGFFSGRGYYTMSNVENCWLCVRGSMPVSNRSIQSLIYAPVREHSRKPDEQYTKIEKLYPDAKYLELFARRQRQGSIELPLSNSTSTGRQAPVMT